MLSPEKFSTDFGPKFPLRFLCFPVPALLKFILILLCFLSQVRISFSHGTILQVNLAGVMDEPVQNNIRNKLVHDYFGVDTGMVWMQGLKSIKLTSLSAWSGESFSPSIWGMNSFGNHGLHSIIIMIYLEYTPLIPKEYYEDTIFAKRYRERFGN